MSSASAPCAAAVPALPDPRAELAALTRARGPARRALAAIAAWIVAGRTWERLGFARPADYARERAGLSARELQDLAHVAGVCGRLPRLERALVTGELGWTKVRLLARVATPEDVSAWVACAHRLTARALAREVRAVDRGALERGGASDLDDDDERETVVIRCTPAVNARWWSVRQLARRVAGEPIPVWGCMEAVAAEVAAGLGIDAAADPEPSPLRLDAEPPLPNGCAAQELEAAFDGPEPDAALAVPDLPEVAELLAGLASADAAELDRRLRAAVRLEQVLDARVAEQLFTVTEGRLHRASGATLDDFARDRLGMSPSRARALVRVERAARRWPALRAGFRAGELSWVQAHALAPLADLRAATGWRAAWLAWTAQVTVRRLVDDVGAALVLADADPDLFARTGGLPDRQTGAQPRARQEEVSARSAETSRVFFNTPREVARLFRATLCTVRRGLERGTGRLPTEGEAFGWMLAHATAAWTEQEEAHRRAHRVFERDGWRCTAPGCSSLRNLHDHHIEFRSAGGGNELANRTTLCAWHHLRGVHAGLLRLRGRAPHGLRFEMPLGTYRSGDRRG